MLHIISLVGVRENIRATLAATQHDYSVMPKTHEVSLGYWSFKVIQGRLPSSAFRAIAIGESVIQGDILLKQNQPLAERFYQHLIAKSTLPLHTSWPDKLLKIAQQEQMLGLLESHKLRGYALAQRIDTRETAVGRTLMNDGLPEI